MHVPKVNLIWTVVGGVAISAVVFAGNAQLGHYNVSAQTTYRSIENEAKLEPILKIIEQLGDREISEDAAEAERAKLCRMGMITDKPTCREVGEEVVE